MGVSLYYSTTGPITDLQYKSIQERVVMENGSREWWCESLWICDKPMPDGKYFGSTKLFCLVSDEDVDTYMAYLDVCEICRFLGEVSSDLEIDWALEIEGAPLGNIRNGQSDAELQANLQQFLDLYPGDFAPLRARKREEILMEWTAGETCRTI